MFPDVESPDGLTTQSRHSLSGLHPSAILRPGRLRSKLKSLDLLSSVLFSLSLLLGNMIQTSSRRRRKTAPGRRILTLVGAPAPNFYPRTRCSWRAHTRTRAAAPRA